MFPRRVLCGLFMSMVMSASALAGISSAGELTGSFSIGDARFSLGAKYKPDRAPAKRFVPIALNSWMRMKTDTGSLPPRVDRIAVDVDKNIRFARRGLGVCDPESIEFASSRGARQRCGSALVGGGRVKTVIDLEDQDPFVASGPLLIFNAVDSSGRPAMVLHTLASVPLPTVFVIVVRIQPSPLGRYGRRLVVEVPEIAQGQGVLTSFRVRLHKRPQGKRFLTARCPTGRAKVQAEFDLHPEPPRYPDGRDFSVSMVGSCGTAGK